MALISIEGLDGSGKSTLAAEITKELIRRGEHVMELHFGPPTYDNRSEKSYGEQAIHEMDVPLTGYVPNLRHSVVMDRAHWGCPAYGPVFRPIIDQGQGFGELTAGEFWRFHDKMDQYGALQVYVHVDVMTALSRTNGARDELLTDDDKQRYNQLEMVQANYDRLLEAIASHGGLLVHWLELTKPESATEVASDLVDKAFARENTVARKEMAPW